jgi:tetratricopeptide (TPR) repeat protein
MPNETIKNFFISYNSADRSWAEWIAWHLEEAGYTTIVQAWDFRPGSNFVQDMHSAASSAERTMAVLSPDYLTSSFTQPEWAAAFARDPTGEKGLLLPVRVRECEPKGLLPQIVDIDISRLVEPAAKNSLLAGVVRGRVKPASRPAFPGTQKRPATPRPRFPGTLPPVWNIPFNRNPNFTGRVGLLQGLRKALTSGKPAALTQAIYGLGGVGKTQTAVEYAYRFATDYEVVWWIRAEEATTLAADYAALAVELGLPENVASEPSAIVKAVRRWLGQNAGWLLVFDNAQGVTDIRNYLPQGSTGHVIVTSRDPNWKGVASALPVEPMKRKEAVNFLLKRTKSTSSRAASRLAEALGDLPLALEQAGAYIEETGCLTAHYLTLFKTHPKKLLRRGARADFQATVATIWEISFEQVKKKSPAAQDLLCLCAFLAPDEIPLQVIISKGIQHLPGSLATAMKDPIAFDDVVASLRKYSLVKVSENSLLSVHRLVQAVGRARLKKKDLKNWAEIAVLLLSEAFQFDSADMRTWPACSTLLPHALKATEHAKALQVAYLATGRLLTALGRYSVGRAEFVKVKAAFEQALAIDEDIHGPEDPTVAEDANNLGFLLKNQGDLKGARKFFERALKIKLKVYGPQDPEVAVSRNNLGIILKDLRDLQGAQKEFGRALKINLERLGKNHTEVAVNYNNLGYLLKDEGDMERAQAYFKRGAAQLQCRRRAIRDMERAQEYFELALKINRADPGDNRASIATNLNNLGIILKDRDDTKRAHTYFKQALKISEAFYGPDHPEVATNLNNLGYLMKDKGDAGHARLCFERALKISEASYGPNHPEVATNLNNLGYLMKDKGDAEDARVYFERALSINEAAYGIDHPNVASTLNNLGDLRKAKGDFNGAQAYFERALAIDEAAYGSNHPDVAMNINQLGSVLQLQGDLQRARNLYKRSVRIFEKALGADHPHTLEARNNLASLDS